MLRQNRTVDVQRAEDLFDDEDDAEVGPRQFAGQTAYPRRQMRPPQPPADPTDIARVLEFSREAEQKAAKKIQDEYNLKVQVLMCFIVVLLMHYGWNRFMVDGVVKPLKGIHSMLEGIDDKLLSLERNTFYP